MLAMVLSAGLLSSPVFAQSGPAGSLSGIVQDPNGAHLPGVSVTVRSVATDATRTAITDSEGRWTIRGLAVGTYQVTYELAGFKRLVRDQMTVEASVTRTLDDKLQIGELDAVVNITEGATLVVAESATTFRQLSSEDLVTVPTSTRSFTQLLSTEAGVNTDLSPVLTNGNGNQSPSVNGTRTTSTSLFFNGVDATNITSNEGSLNDNIAPAPETLQEVKLQTSLYDASTGRSGGGNFQLVTKQGTNKFNGSLYYYFQNEKLNANDYFFNKEGIDRPKARRNETGFTVGGPIVKEKFFFFGSYQYTDAITGFVPTARSTTVLPLALSRISGPRTAAALATAFNAENGCTPGVNCLSPTDVSPTALRLFNLINPVTGDFVIPSPRAGARPIGLDRAGARAFLFGFAPDVASRTLRENNPLVQQLNVQPSEFNQHQLTTRLDGRLTKNNTLNGTFFLSNFPGLDSFPDPSSLASPFTLRRADQNRTLAVSDHTFLDQL